MSTMPHLPQEQQSALASASRMNTVIMGQQNFAHVLLRLIGVELYKIRQRALSKALISIGVCIMVGVFLLLSINAFVVLSRPLQQYGLRRCSPQEVIPPSAFGHICIDHAPTQKDIAQAQQIKHLAVLASFTPLYLPVSLFNAVSVTLIAGAILLVILAGTMVGGEYSGGTIRLALTRGPTRAQFLLGKIGALLLCAVLGFFILVLTGLVTGILLTLPAGITPSLHFLQHGGWVHVLLSALVALFGLFISTLLALFLATVGRSTAAGIAGALIWVVLENMLSAATQLLAPSPVEKIVKAIPDYFMSTNVIALLQNQSHYVTDTPLATLSNLHAVLVLLGYLVVFIALSLWVGMRRDITS